MKMAVFYSLLNSYFHNLPNKLSNFGCDLLIANWLKLLTYRWYFCYLYGYWCGYTFGSAGKCD